MDGGRSGGDYSLRPGPSGQGLGSLSLPVAEPSRSEYGGRSSPLLRVWRKTTALVLSYSLDLDRDDSFRSMLCLIQEFHSFEEPKSVAPNRCKTSVAPVYGLQSESSPALHLLLSAFLWSLLEDTNSALAKFVEDQTVHAFLPVPSRCHWKYYRTSSSSFLGQYSAPASLASVTLEKVSESRKRSVSLSYSQVSSLETCSRVCVRPPPCWTGGCPLAGDSGSI